MDNTRTATIKTGLCRRIELISITRALYHGGPAAGCRPSDSGRNAEFEDENKDLYELCTSRARDQSGWCRAGDLRVRDGTDERNVIYNNERDSLGNATATLGRTLAKMKLILKATEAENAQLHLELTT